MTDKKNNFFIKMESKYLIEYTIISFCLETNIILLIELSLKERVRVCRVNVS